MAFIRNGGVSSNVKTPKGRTDEMKPRAPKAPRDTGVADTSPAFSGGVANSSKGFKGGRMPKTEAY